MRERRWVATSVTSTAISASVDMDGDDVIIIEPALSESNEEGASELLAPEDRNLDTGSVEIEDVPADPAEMSSNCDNLEEESVDSLPQRHLLSQDEQER